jgi:hypothetical protein
VKIELAANITSGNVTNIMITNKGGMVFTNVTHCANHMDRDAVAVVAIMTVFCLAAYSLVLAFYMLRRSRDI